MSAQDIVLSPEESAELSRRTRSATISQRDGRRARVILLAAQGCSRVEIARLVGFSLRSVTLWCKRFQERHGRVLNGFGAHRAFNKLL
ncbi:helix-turn-helix domain-containing protein, partial [Pseudomonas savastanoi]